MHDGGVVVKEICVVDVVVDGWVDDVVVDAGDIMNSCVMYAVVIGDVYYI